MVTVFKYMKKNRQILILETKGVKFKAMDYIHGLALKYIVQDFSGKTGNVLNVVFN